MCADKSTRELVIKELPSQAGAVPVVLNPDHVAGRSNQSVKIHDVKMCDCLVCQLVRAEDLVEQLKQALLLAGSIMHVTKEAVEQFRALVTVDNPYLEQLIKDCMANEGGAI